MCGCLSHTPQLGTWPATQACALNRNRIGDLLVCRPVLNPLSHNSQGYSLIFREVFSHLSTISLTLVYGSQLEPKIREKSSNLSRYPFKYHILHMFSLLHAKISI